MSPFEWLDDLEKSGYLEAYDKRRFQGRLTVVTDDESKTFTISLSWTDKANNTGEIFIPAEGVKKINLTVIELEENGFSEKLGDQTFPP